MALEIWYQNFRVVEKVEWSVMLRLEMRGLDFNLEKKQYKKLLVFITKCLIQQSLKSFNDKCLFLYGFLDSDAAPFSGTII